MWVYKIFKLPLYSTSKTDKTECYSAVEMPMMGAMLDGHCMEVNYVWENEWKCQWESRYIQYEVMTDDDKWQTSMCNLCTLYMHMYIKNVHI